jgi:hypothetical protein
MSMESVLSLDGKAFQTDGDTVILLFRLTSDRWPEVGAVLTCTLGHQGQTHIDFKPRPTRIRPWRGACHRGLPRALTMPSLCRPQGLTHTSRDNGPEPHKNSPYQALSKSLQLHGLFHLFNSKPINLLPIA